jgi:carboxyl-terminal processing protease
MDSFNRKIVTLAVVLSLVTGFAGGFAFQKHNDSVSLSGGIKELANRDSNKVDFELFWNVWDSLQAKYVDKSKIDTQKMVYGAISGMVNATGDPYTVFFEPQVSKKFQEEISGAFGGVGMEIGKRNDILTVISPIKNTPASRAGIKAGDKILKIDAKSTADMSVDEAVNLIRGTRGTKVTITLATGAENTIREVILTRETIKIPAVTWKLINDHVAYMEISAFNQNVDSEFKKAAQEIIKSKADRLIIDLRNNPGGLLDSAVNLAGWFLDKNSIVTVEDMGNGNRNEFRSSGDGSLKPYQTIFLVNGGSASASEILAGAVHDNRGIKLVGEKTFGKGSVQELVKFDDGSSLKVTIAKWLTPNGISISEKGIEADVEVKIDPKLIEKNGILFGELGKDPQLDKALEILK